MVAEVMENRLQGRDRAGMPRKGAKRIVVSFNREAVRLMQEGKAIHPGGAVRLQDRKVACMH